MSAGIWRENRNDGNVLLRRYVVVSADVPGNWSVQLRDYALDLWLAEGKRLGLRVRVDTERAA